MSNKKKYTPGSIFVRKNTNRLYISIFQTQISTGLKAYDENRNKIKESWNRCQEILEHHYLEYLRNENKLPEHKKESIIFLDKIFQEFIETWQAKGRMKSTIYSYDIAKRTIFQKNIPLQKNYIETEIKEFIKNTRLSDTSINIHLRGIRTFLNYCFDSGYLKEKINIYKEHKRDTRNKEVMPYNIIEYQNILDEAEKNDYEWSLLLKFLYLTGARINETLQLYWKNVNFETGLITFPNKIKKGVLQFFPITQNLKLLLEELNIISQQRQTRKDKIFRWLPTSDSSLARKLKKIELKLEIKKLGRAFHGFRKSFGDKLFEKDVSIYDIQDLMRHQDIKTTIEHYKTYHTKKLKSVLEEIEK